MAVRAGGTGGSLGELALPRSLARSLAHSLSMPHLRLLGALLLLSLGGGALARKKKGMEELQQEFSKLVKDADDAIHSDRHGEAVKMLDEALELMDAVGAGFAEGDLRFNRATALKSLDRYEEAIADYEVTIKTNPKDTGALTGAARLMSKIEEPRLEEALGYYDAAIALQKPPTKGKQAAKTAKNNLFHRANLYMKMERFEDARDGFEAAVAIDPKFSQALANLGVALKQLGKEKLSAESFAKAKAINPDHVMIETKETTIDGSTVVTGDA